MQITENSKVSVIWNAFETIKTRILGIVRNYFQSTLNITFLSQFPILYIAIIALGSLIKLYFHVKRCDATTVKDLNTKELTLSLRDDLFAETGKHLISIAA